MGYAFINMDGNYMLELHDEIFINADEVALLERERILKAFEESDSACASWAMAIVRGEDV